MSKYLILVPARFGSTRFPGKPLAKIAGKPMIEYVVNNCQQSGFDYAVVTDNDEVEAIVKGFGGNIVRVDDQVSTGSERIALAYERYFSNFGYEYIINVQGDEPLLKGEIIRQIGQEHGESSYDIFTGVKKQSSENKDYLNPNIVKCIWSGQTQQCLYFSRAAIPYVREEREYSWFQHIGIYSYTTKSLQDFVKLKASYYEEVEKLEQLRALESGFTIGAKNLNINLVGVDTPEDIEKVERIIK